MFHRRREFIKALMSYTSLAGCSHMSRKPQAAPSRRVRIAILGGGAAGVSAAHFLQKNGYKNIVIYEASNRLGGKSNTVHISQANYEMGTVGGAKSYRVIKELSDHYNVSRIQIPSNRTFHYIDNLEGANSPASRRDLFDVLTGYSDYVGDLKKEPYRSLERSHGFQNLPKELCMSFSKWAEKNNWNPKGLQYFLNYTVTPYGYGYPDEIPAAYILKYFERSFFTSFMKHATGIRKELFIMKNGYQNLWESIIAGLQKENSTLEVRMSAKVSKILRMQGDKHIQVVEEGRQPEVFDFLILACPHQHTPKIINDFGQEELRILNKVNTYAYYSFAVDTSVDWPTQGVFPINYNRAREKHPVFWYRRWPKLPVTIFYAYANDPNTPADEVLKVIKADAKKYKWPFGKVHVKRQWEYFPHFKTSDLEDGVYDRLESIQGYKNTYRVGELMSFATVELVSRYSKNLVNTFFK